MARRPVIRPFRPEDAAGVAAVLLEVGHDGLVTAQGVRHYVESLPGRAEARFWVAIEDDEIVGWAPVRRKWSSDPNVVRVRAAVSVEARGRGTGSELWRLAEEYALSLRPRQLQSYVADDDAASRDFLERRGFRPARQTIISMLEVASCPAPAVPQDVTVYSVRGFPAGEHALFDLYWTTEEDLPADQPHGRLSFEEWRYETLEHPDLSRDGSFVALVDGVPVSFSFLQVDPARGTAWNEMTGTLPAYRGRGLARLVKSFSIRWAAENGLSRIFTGNDHENAPMLAVNRALGYVPVKTFTDYVRAGREGTTANTPSSMTRT